MGETVETYGESGEWLNRIAGRNPLPGSYRTREAACEVARAEARIRGVEHVILGGDGGIAEHTRSA